MSENNSNKHNPYLDEHHQPYGQNAGGIDSRQHSDNQPKPNVLDERTLRSAQSQTSVAFVAGPLSLFIGGVLLGGIGLICAWLAYRKLRKLAVKTNAIASKAQQMMKSARMALIICLISVAVNAVSLIFMYPIVMQMLDSGDYAQVAGNMSAGTAAGTSTWG